MLPARSSIFVQRKEGEKLPARVAWKALRKMVPGRHMVVEEPTEAGEG